jgi:hypothetical protein
MASTDVGTVITNSQDNATSALKDAIAATAADLSSFEATYFTITDPNTLNFDTYDKASDILNALIAGKPTSPLTNLSKFQSSIADVKLSDISYTETSVPELSASAPSLDYGTKPESTMPDAPTMEAMKEVSVPTTPVVTYPSEPSISDTTIPTLDSYEEPLLSASLPNLSSLTAPTTEFTWVEEAYNHLIQDDIVTALQTDIGGGLLPDETSEISKITSAADKILKQQTEDISRTYTGNGFYFPSGVLTKAINEAQQANVESKLTSLETLKVDYMKIRISNRQSAIASGINLEKMLRDYCSALNERSLNYEKAVIEKAIALFDSQIEAKKLYIDNYNAGVNGYNAEWQGVTTKLTAYKTKMEGASISVEIKKVLVDIYVAKVNTIKVKYDIYKTQMEAARLNFDMESAKLSRYKAMIDAYAERVRAKVAEFELYKATIQGELGKIEVYKTQVEAFKSQVEAAKIQTDIRKTSADMTIEQNKEKISKLMAEIELYKVEATSHYEYQKTLIQKYATDVDAWRVDVTANNEAWKLWMQISTLATDQTFKKALQQTEVAKYKVDKSYKEYSIRVQALHDKVETYRDIVRGYLNAINTLAVQEKSSST